MPLLPAPPNATPTPAYPGFSFITFSDPRQSKLPRQRKAVRSHAAFYQHHADKPVPEVVGAPPASSSTRRRRQARKRKEDAAKPLEPGASTHANEPSVSLAPYAPSPRSTLGEGRIDPFRTYPVPWEPCLPELIDHYVAHMAIDMPELDEPQRPGLLRTAWLPMAMSGVATFRVIILLSASHHASMQRPHGDGTNLLLLKARAISSINDALAAADNPTSDLIIAAVAKMASYEAMFGDQPTYEMHMKGLAKMVQLRGGLPSLGLGGLLARICVWIDRNSAFLHNSGLHFTSVNDEHTALANISGFLDAS